jgi:tripartite-type tricarboxylate transporter receptor subunit TctC
MGWQALVAPKGTPAVIVHQLVDDLRKAMEVPDVRARMGHVGTPFRPTFSTELARFVEAEQRLWWPIVKDSKPK